MICSGATEGLGDGNGDTDGDGDGTGSPVISSHQYVCPKTTAKVPELPGKVAMLPLMLVSNSVSINVLVVPSKVSSANGPLASLAGTCHAVMGNA